MTPKFIRYVEFSKVSYFNIGKAVRIKIALVLGLRKRWCPSQKLYEANLKMVNDIVPLERLGA